MTIRTVAEWEQNLERSTTNLLALLGLPGHPGTRHDPPRPTGPVRLYRGSTFETRHGIYWTDVLEVATAYAADARRKGRQARVYTAVIPPAWIFAGPTPGTPRDPAHPYGRRNGEHFVHPGAFLTVPILELPCPA